MFGSVLLLTLFVSSGFARRSEPACGQFEYDEKLLSKMIRTEIDVEALTKRLETLETQLEAKHALAEAVEGKLGILESSVKSMRENKNRQGVSTPRIGFTAHHPDKSSDILLRFKEVFSNYGNDFNPTTGTFKCRIPGLYLFTATIVVETTSTAYTYCFLFVGSNRKIVVGAHSKDADFPSASASLVFLLKTGDQVYLGECVHPRRINEHSYFSGVLIN